jgi:hypothetical protein
LPSMKLDVKRQLFARSERVKGIDFHPTEPWVGSDAFLHAKHVLIIYRFSPHYTQDMLTSGHTRHKQLSRPLNLLMSPFALVASLHGKTGSFAVLMTFTCAYTITTRLRRSLPSRHILITFAPLSCTQHSLSSLPPQMI